MCIDMNIIIHNLGKLHNLARKYKITNRDCYIHLYGTANTMLMVYNYRVTIFLKLLRTDLGENYSMGGGVG